MQHVLAFELVCAGAQKSKSRVSNSLIQKNNEENWREPLLALARAKNSHSQVRLGYPMTSPGGCVLLGSTPKKCHQAKHLRRGGGAMRSGAERRPNFGKILTKAHHKSLPKQGPNLRPNSCPKCGHSRRANPNPNPIPKNNFQS